MPRESCLPLFCVTSFAEVHSSWLRQRRGLDAKEAILQHLQHATARPALIFNVEEQILASRDACAMNGSVKGGPDEVRHSTWPGREGTSTQFKEPSPRVAVASK